MLEKALSIVSVRTYVPLIIATPSTIASAVRIVRNLRATKALQREARHVFATSFIVSEISCCVAPASSRTMLPSAR